METIHEITRTDTNKKPTIADEEQKIYFETRSRTSDGANFNMSSIRSIRVRPPQSDWVTRCLFATVVLVSLAVATSDTHSQQEAPDYRNPRLPVDQRVADLLSRMTLEEKVAQLVCLWAGRPEAKPPSDFSTDRGEFSPEKAAQVMKYGMGQIGRQRERKDARQGAIFANAVQKWLLENTRLGIPAILHDEILHGHMARGSTSFPQPLALASSWDPAFISQVFTAGALETRARGSHQVLGPNLDVAREPRWGRTEETYGEDPYLV